MLHEQKRATAPATRSTIRTEAGCAVITAMVGRVSFNGASMLPHEATLIASELERCAGIAARKADELAAQARQAA